MSGYIRSLLLSLSAILFLPYTALPQGRPGRPALIRDTDTAEGKETAEPSKPKEFNPLEAEKSLKIGNYYYKLKNYGAAILRFREALEYQPNNAAARSALDRSLQIYPRACEKKGTEYERKGEQVKASDLYKEFISVCPDSPKVRDFQTRLEKLAKQEKLKDFEKP